MADLGEGGAATNIFPQSRKLLEYKIFLDYTNHMGAWLSPLLNPPLIAENLGRSRLRRFSIAADDSNLGKAGKRRECGIVLTGYFRI